MLVVGLLAVSFAGKTDPTPPHLAQAWQAQSTGDGEQGKTGLESYIYEDCKKTSDTCMKGHVFNYGADTSIKHEVDRGFHEFTGTYYVKCDEWIAAPGDVDKVMDMAKLESFPRSNHLPRQETDDRTQWQGGEMMRGTALRPPAHEGQGELHLLRHHRRQRHHHPPH